MRAVINTILERLACKHKQVVSRKLMYLRNRRLATIAQREAVAKRYVANRYNTVNNQFELNFQMYRIKNNLKAITTGYTA